MHAALRRSPILLPLLALAAFLLLAAACGDDTEEDTSGFATDTPAATQDPATEPPAQTSDCPAPVAQAPEPDMTKQYDSKPEMTIDTSKRYTAVVKTERGDITLELRPDLAPEHVNSFVFLANEGFYDGVTFHRVVPDFVAQAGDPTGTGSGGPGYNLEAEFNSEPFVRGVLGMARSQDPNSAGSQWFITLGDAPNLNNQYTLFGTVTDGMDVVDCIEQGDGIVTIEISE